MKQRKMSSLQTYCLLKAITSFDVLKAIVALRWPFSPSKQSRVSDSLWCVNSRVLVKDWLGKKGFLWKVSARSLMAFELLFRDDGTSEGDVLNVPWAWKLRAYSSSFGLICCGVMQLHSLDPWQHGIEGLKIRWSSWEEVGGMEDVKETMS